MILSSVFSSITAAAFLFHFPCNMDVYSPHSAILLYISFNLFCLWKLLPSRVPGPNSLSYWNGWDCQILIKTFLSLLSPPLQLEFAFPCQSEGAAVMLEQGRKEYDGWENYVYSLVKIWNKENTLAYMYLTHSTFDRASHDNKYLIRCQYIMKIYVKIILVVPYNANECTRTASNYEC